MYNACRHIKTSGLRCKSRALAGANFCYFHSRLHIPQPYSCSEPLMLPVLEDLDSIPLAVARISEALIAGRIDVKISAQLFWGLKLASQAIACRSDCQPYSVESLTKSSEGDDLAPEQNYCVPENDCKTCDKIATCPNSLYEFVEDHDDDDDDDDDDEDKDDRDEEADNEEKDEDDVDDCLKNESIEELVADAKYLESISNALNDGDMRQVEQLLKE